MLTLNVVVMGQQSSTIQPENVWETSNTYLIGTSLTSLGAIIVMTSKQELDITPQAGPSINWVNTDAILNESYQSIGVKTNTLWGYSVGSMITKNKNNMSYKVGMFIESKGYSYTFNGIVTGSLGVQENYYMSGYCRFNYLTIPLTIGVNTNVGVSLDFGGFVSLPTSNKSGTYINSVFVEDNNVTHINPDFGLMVNLGYKKPINETMDVRFDTRYLSGMNNVREPLLGKLYNQTLQFLLGINIKLNKKQWL